MLVSDIEMENSTLTGLGLNPCFSGCWSRTAVYGFHRVFLLAVLILVLVDVGLGRRCGRGALPFPPVLILVLVDVGLGQREMA